MRDRPALVPQPLAYLITFRCYGTWLAGDRRGWVKRCPGGSRIHSPDDGIRRASERLLATDPVTLDARQRLLIHRTIVQVCAARGWKLLALNVRTNHVHAVVAGPGAPEDMMNAFKAFSTRMLRKAHAAPNDGRLWARHGSTRYLWHEEAVVAACSYVRDQ